MRTATPQENLLTQIGEKIKANRSAQNLSQEQLAEIASITSNFISLVECGDTNPSIIKLFQIANALGMELPELVNVSK